MGVKSLSLTNKTEKAFVNDKDLTPSELEGKENGKIS